MNIPKNIILTNQYTAGSEYFLQGSNTPYKGYYFIVSGKAFTGKEPSDNSLPLEKITDKIKNFIKNQINNILKRYMFQPTSEDAKKGYVTRYFAQKDKEIPLKIMEISKDTYDSIQNEPGYKSTSIDWNLIYSNELKIEEANKKLPGLKQYLENLNISPNSDEENLFKDSF